MDTRIQLRLANVAKRLRSVRTGWSLAALWLGAALCGWLIIVTIRNGTASIGELNIGETAWRERVVIAWLSTVAVAALLLVWLGRVRRPNYSQVVERLERRFPELEQRLLTASQIQLDAPSRPAGYLQRCVISEAIRHDVHHGWTSLVSSWRIALAWLINVPALLCLLTTAWVLWKTPGSEVLTAARSSVANRGEIVTPIVEPGDTELERGSSLIVTARFEAHVPDEVWLVHAPSSRLSRAATGGGENPVKASESVTRVRMRPSLDDPIFAAYLNDVNEPLEYRIEYEQSATQAYHVDVFEVPTLVRADAELIFPDYTQQQPRTVLDTRRITVAVGTQVTWKLQLNKQVTSAELIPAEGEAIVLTPNAESPSLVETTMLLTESQQWLLRLVDAEGRTNAMEIKLRANVLPNGSAKIQLLAGGDVRVSPLEEFDVSAKVSDDFAVTATGIGYQFGGGDLVELTTMEIEGQSRQATFSQRINFEELAAQPLQLLSYYVWAEDRGEDGSVRRTESDMYFAEVRPFEEIFREGEQPSSDQQQQQQQQQQGENPQTEELLELQKQIVVATWNMIRAARAGQLSETVKSDLDLLVESQTNAIELLEEKAAEVQQAELQPIIEQASEAMQSATERLSTTLQSLAKSDLSQALKQEQTAYQALLQLQSLEHEVVRGQQNPSSSSGSARSRQAQLEQLELKNEENRYEDERLAQSQEDGQQSELRQIISRLRELAARQEDFNQQLRELQAALQAAETPEEREEIERELERLREQQQQMLADSDELSERMQSPENPAMQDAQQEIQQARDNMQRSSEALSKDQPGEALAAGTRAEQQLKDLQDDVRKQTSNQFQESMQQMKQQAADLEQQQSDLAHQLSGQTPEGESEQPSAGLRDDDSPREQAAQQLRRQQNELKKLLEKMEETVTDAEESEPLLAQRLYESYRRTQQSKALERLQVTEQLLERNLEQPASELAQESKEELSQLRQEIDQAAEAVLGSEIESLRLALSKIDALSEQLEQEISREAGQAHSDNDTNGPNESNEPSGTPQPDQAGNSQQSNAAGQRNEREEANESDRPNEAGQSNESGEANESEQQLGQAGQPNESEQQPGQAGQPNEAGQQQGQEGQPEGSGQQPGRAGQPRESGQPSRAGEGNRTGGRNQTASGDTTPQPGQANSRDARPFNPLTGDGFREWSDGLRDVEELVSDSELRWQATEIRQAARELRTDMKRHSAEPRWQEVEEMVATPLRELKRKVADELVRRAADKTQIVPLDRDPVPSEFSRGVRKYFENLGSGQ